jgi:hypothetical protein
LKGCAIDECLSLRVIRCILLIQETHLKTEAKKKHARDGTPIPNMKPAIRDTVCGEFGVGILDMNA